MENVTVTKCAKLKDWVSPDGKSVPIYQVEMSSGIIGQSFQDIPVGTPNDQLTFTPNPPYNDKVKWNKPNTGGAAGGWNKGGNRAGNESFALAYSKDLAVAYVAAGKQIEPEKVTAWAEIFYQWMETKKK